jgi:hypothetical protein
MAQGKVLPEVINTIRRRQADIRAWQAQKQGYRKIAQQLGVSPASYLRALATIEKDAEEPTVSDVDKRLSTNTHALAKVYEGTPIHLSEGRPAWLDEVSTHLPALRELQEILPVLKTMARQWSEQQTLTQIPDEYKKYGATYSVRLNERLIEALKAYAQRHRLTQSEAITMAVQHLLSQE